MTTPRRASRTLIYVAAVLATAIIARPELAAAEMIVVESYSESRPGDADKTLAPLIDELRSHGFVVQEPLAAQVSSRVSRGTRQLSRAELDEARRSIASGIGHYRDGDYKLAVETIQRGIGLLEAAPLTMVRDQKTRDIMLEALIYLSQSSSRLGKAVAATRAMAELIRSFPDRDISHAQHGPEPRQLFLKVKADLANQGLGQLSIKVDDPRSVVFVNERYISVGSTVLKDIFPGRYRVFVQQAERAGRLHTVDVEAGSDAGMDITWGIDGALRSEGNFVGFVFASEAERAEHEAGYAIRLSRALDASGVAVVGVHEYSGRRSIIAAVYSNDATRPVRSAVLAVEPVAPAEDEVRAMARFLAGDEAAAKMFANLASEPGPSAKSTQSHRDAGRRPYRTWKWIGVLGGIATIGTGVTLMAIHEPDVIDGSRNENALDTRTAGIVATAIGAVVTAAGAYLWIRDRKDAREARVSMVPARSGAVLVVTGGF